MSETYQLNQSKGEYILQTLASIDATALLSFNDDNVQYLHVAKTPLILYKYIRRWNSLVS